MRLRNCVGMSLLIHCSFFCFCFWSPWQVLFLCMLNLKLFVTSAPRALILELALCFPYILLRWGFGGEFVEDLLR